MKKLSARDHVLQPWKNGQGTTLEIAADRGDPPGDGFVWRVSIASVARSSPFSRFEGYDRSIMVIAGAGMQLAHDGGPPIAVAARFRPYRFRGEWSTDCALLEGPIEDFNVMTRRSRARHELAALAVGVTPLCVDPAGDVGLLVALDGPLSASTAGARYELAPRDALWLERGEGALELSAANGEAAVAWVTIAAAAG